MPFFPERGCIVIPKKYSSQNTNIIAHPAEPPLLSSFLNSCTRYFFAFDVDKTIKIVYDNCFNFAPLRNTPHTSDNRRRQKVAIGVSCAADAMHKKGNTFNST